MPLRESWGWVGAANAPQVKKSIALAKTGNVMLTVQLMGDGSEWITRMQSSDCHFQHKGACP